MFGHFVGGTPKNWIFSLMKQSGFWSVEVHIIYRVGAETSLCLVYFYKIININFFQKRKINNFKLYIGFYFLVFTYIFGLQFIFLQFYLIWVIKEWSNWLFFEPNLLWKFINGIWKIHFFLKFTFGQISTDNHRTRKIWKKLFLAAFWEAAN